MTARDSGKRSAILVTGAPRSGTTVLGHSMAFSPDVNYLWEPFNLRFRRGVPDYYPYVGPSTAAGKRETYQKLIRDTLELKNLAANIEIKKSDSLLYKAGKTLGINRNALHYWSVRLRQFFSRPTVLLCKDPIAVFLSRHLLTDYQFKVVGVVRHPAAVTVSRRQRQWKFDFSQWRRQPDLYADHFQAIDLQMQHYDVEDYVVECGFHWLTCYSFLNALKQEFPEQVLLVRHEDYCLDPQKVVRQLFAFSGIQVDDAVLSRVGAVTSGDALEKKSQRLADLESRDAKRLVDKWKKRVSTSELALLEQITGEVSKEFYPSADQWAIDIPQSSSLGR